MLQKLMKEDHAPAETGKHIAAPYDYRSRQFPSGNRLGRMVDEGLLLAIAPFGVFVIACASLFQNNAKKKSDCGNSACVEVNIYLVISRCMKRKE